MNKKLSSFGDLDSKQYKHALIFLDVSMSVASVFSQDISIRIKHYKNTLATLMLTSRNMSVFYITLHRGRLNDCWAKLL